jgi:hypothetical protein
MGIGFIKNEYLYSTIWKIDFMKYLVFIILLTGITLYSEEDNFQYSKARYKSFFTIYTGFVNGAFDNGFFDIYKKDFKGSKSSFSSYPLIGVSFKYQYFPHYKFGISAEYIYSDLNESYTEYIDEPELISSRDYIQSITVSSIPILFTVDLVPRELPYRTFVGVGAGLSINKIKWNESISSHFPYDVRIGGTVIDDNFISPVFSFYTGVELDFDKEYKYSVVGGLIIEGKVLYIIRSKKYFQSISKQFSKKNNNFNENYTILPVYFGLNIGVSLNFYKFK